MNKEKVTISVRIDKDVKEQFAKVCKAMGLNISDAINIFARKVVSEQAIPFEVKLKSNQEDTNIKVIKERQMSRQEELAILFPPASAEKVRKLQAKLRRNGNEEKPVMVDSSGQRNVISHLRGKEIGRATHNNLLDVIQVEGEEE